jgi:flagellar hook protein FlgE
MSLYGMMRTSVSGMAAQANRLSAVSDNIANSDTDGYKAANTDFSSLVVPGSPGDYNSGGVETTITHSVTQPGSIRYTTSSTDLALQGNGFFVVTDSAGVPYLTRAGSFVPDAQGNLVNTAGYYLMGYPYNGSTINSVANGYAGLQVVNVSQQGLVASPSTTGNFSANLPSTATAVAAANLPSTNSATAQFTQKTSLVTYDNLGNQVTLDLYMTKTGANTWEVAAYNSADASAAGGFPYANPALATTTLQFDPTTGQLAAASATSLSVPIPNGQSLTLDMTGTTQLAGSYSVFQANVNGNAPSGLDRVDIGTNGDVTAYYQNGSQKLLYKIPLADVPSPDNLTTMAGNVFSTNQESGAAQIGFAGQNGLSQISSGALEGSNVDLATELTDMIAAQRSYTANSKVFQTGSDLMTTLVNLVR